MKRGQQEVEWFSRWMVAKLDENSHKKSWNEEGMGDLLRGLKAETEEMKEALSLFVADVTLYEFGLEPTQEDRGKLAEEAIRECADVANYAMMLARRVQALATSQNMTTEQSEKVLPMLRGAGLDLDQ